MKKEYDFSGGRRGSVLPVRANKERITIRLDRDVLEGFRAKVEQQGGGSYQAMINEVLKAHLRNDSAQLESTLRRVLREELGNSK
jgi:uncharacterized protein (DUF4415 family)